MDITPKYDVIALRDKIEILDPNAWGSPLATNSSGFQVGAGNNVFGLDANGIRLGGADFSTSPFSVSMAGALVATSLTITGGTIKYGKTSFTDSVNAGYFISALGLYVGAAADASKLKYTLSDGSFDLIGTISSRSTVTIASAINSSGNFINDLINARLDSSSKKILSDFNFGTADYAGAVKAGDITWNGTTGAVTGGSGIVVYRKGIVGAAAGVVTFSIDATTGNATFAGTLSAASGTLGTITSATITAGTFQTAASGQRIALSGSDNTLRFYDSSAQVIGIGSTAATAVRVDLNSSVTTTGVQVVGGNNSATIGFQYSNSSNVLNRAIDISVTGTSSNTSQIINVVNAGTGEALYFDIQGTGTGISINRMTGSGTVALLTLLNSTAVSSNIIHVQKTSSTGTGTSVLIESDDQGTALHVETTHGTSAKPTVRIVSGTSNASGPALLIEKNNEQYAVIINQTVNSGGNTVGMKMNIANAGAGVEYAFEFAGSEYIASATSVSGLTGVIKVLTSDGLVYIPVYSGYA